MLHTTEVSLVHIEAPIKTFKTSLQLRTITVVNKWLQISHEPKSTHEKQLEVYGFLLAGNIYCSILHKRWNGIRNLI